jgi:hypothetical protein
MVVMPTAAPAPAMRVAVITPVLPLLAAGRAALRVLLESLLLEELLFTNREHELRAAIHAR